MHFYLQDPHKAYLNKQLGRGLLDDATYHMPACMVTSSYSVTDQSPHASL